jgi:hypothetical protein
MLIVKQGKLSSKVKKAKVVDRKTAMHTDRAV